MHHYSQALARLLHSRSVPHIALFEVAIVESVQRARAGSSASSFSPGKVHHFVSHDSEKQRRGLSATPLSLVFLYIDPSDPWA
jgi:hypothetical protein